MLEPEVFVLADGAINDVVAQIKDEQWAMEIPPDFVRRQTDRTPTLREIVNYHAYDDAWVPDMLGGRTMEEVGRDEFQGDLLGDDPRGNFAAIVEKAVAAARQLDNLERTVHCSFGDYTAREYLWQANNFRTLRAHDIGKVIGVDAKLPDELVQGVWDEISPHAEEWRAIGVFGPAVPVPEDAPLLDRLLGLTGRHPGR
ncbi:MAG: TIGR03086 family protein [Candidatus Nephthysia bennettiae]|nr:MAG: TIGR03086 family protein [Candidatus Dormibacteraeota bacterium]